ncbi:MAG: fibronectin type III domain-containing protein [Candidatus Paceibacterota bacterium]|nr:fibronectin type III domain-containing protein [Candidatus Paceibacterota bacterium]
MKNNNNDIESRLNNVSVKPLSEQEKGVLWRKIEKGIATPEKVYFWQKIADSFSSFRLQTSVAVALMVAVLFSGTSVAFAYADSAQPGDALFPLSVLKEKIVISLAPTKNQGEMRLKYAQKRIEQGNTILAGLSTNVVTSTSTRALAATIATGTVPATPVYHGGSTSSPAVVGDAVNRLSATIAYLQAIKTDLTNSGNTSGAQSIQTAIDKMLAQVSSAANQNPVIVAKVQEHKNQFNITVSTTIASTTTTTKLALNTKKDTQRVTITEKENTLVTKQVFDENKKNKKDDDKKYNDNNRKYDDHDRDDDRDERDNEKDKDDDKKGFLGWIGIGKKINVCHKGTTINISSSAVNAHLKHGDRTGACTTTTTATTTVDTIAPVISGIASTVTPTTSKIVWNTNENATAELLYGTTTSFGSSVTLSTSRTNQEANLSGLTADTTYHFVIVAKDPSGNSATSTTNSFKTAVVPDTTTPTFSSIAVAHASETATVSWNTSENASGKMYYGTATPLVLSTAPYTRSENALSLNHSFALTGLATSTTYYFVLEGKDAAGNTGTSTEHQFTTGA